MSHLLLFLLIGLTCCNTAGNRESTPDGTNQTHLTKTPNNSVTNQLLGTWTIMLSCDGSMVCNQCPQIIFNSNGSATTSLGQPTFLNNVKWEIENNHVKIKPISGYVYVAEGVYQIKHGSNSDDTVELVLTEIKTSACYRLLKQIQ
jgi:hypothetical protein